MTERPEYVRCIERVHVEHRGETWCGKPAAGWCFESVDHAADSTLQGGRLVPCPECVAAVVGALSGSR